MPRCELTGATTDLHLVVYGEGSGILAKLLTDQSRFVLQKVTTLSIPLPAINPRMLCVLEASGMLPAHSAAAEALRQWFQQDMEEDWRKSASDLSRFHDTLNFGQPDGELPPSPPAALS